MLCKKIQNNLIVHSKSSNMEWSVLMILVIIGTVKYLQLSESLFFCLWFCGDGIKFLEIFYRKLFHPRQEEFNPAPSTYCECSPTGSINTLIEFLWLNCLLPVFDQERRNIIDMLNEEIAHKICPMTVQQIEFGSAPLILWLQTQFYRPTSEIMESDALSIKFGVLFNYCNSFYLAINSFMTMGLQKVTCHAQLETEFETCTGGDGNVSLLAKMSLLSISSLDYEATGMLSLLNWHLPKTVVKALILGIFKHRLFLTDSNWTILKMRLPICQKLQPFITPPIGIIRVKISNWIDDNSGIELALSQNEQGPYYLFKKPDDSVDTCNQAQFLVTSEDLTRSKALNITLIRRQTFSNVCQERPPESLKKIVEKRKVCRVFKYRRTIITMDFEYHGLERLNSKMLMTDLERSIRMIGTINDKYVALLFISHVWSSRNLYNPFIVIQTDQGILMRSSAPAFWNSDILFQQSFYFLINNLATSQVTILLLDNEPSPENNETRMACKIHPPMGTILGERTFDVEDLIYCTGGMELASTRSLLLRVYLKFQIFKVMSKE